MKRKLKGVLGVALAFMLVVSLMAFAVPVAAADYEENDWGEWGLPAIEPGTDVGPIAVAPDGTLYAAVGPTGILLTLEDDGTGVAEFSTTEQHSGSSSVFLSVSNDTEYAELYFPVNIKVEDIDLANTGFWAYSTAGTYIPYIMFYIEGGFTGTSDILRINNDAATVASGPYGGVWGEYVASTSGPTWQWEEIDTSTWTVKDSGWDTWADLVTKYGSETVLEVMVSNSGITASTFPLSAYIDDVTINGLTYDLEGTTGTTGEALLGFGSELQMSEDDGYSWDDTDLDDAVAPIVAIAVSPNYEEDETVYVGCSDGTVYRVEEAGDESQAIMRISGVAQLFSLDVWTDEDDYNWILVGTDIDVFVLKDKTFERWRDQALNLPAFEVAFAPDFDDDQLMWAVTVDDGDFLVTSTVSPGDWGQEIGEVDLPVTATPWLDIGFPDDYDSDPDTGDTNLWLAVSGGADSGDIFLIEGVDAADGDSHDIPMFTEIGDEDAVDFLSIAVSGDYGDEVILAGELNSPTIWISDDGGYSWGTVDKSPTGENFTHVIMETDVVWDGEVFDPDDGMAFASTFGNESAVSKSTDGGQVYNQVGLIDTEIDAILDLGFHPDFPSNAIFLMITEDDDYDTYSLWLTENGDEDEPDYERVLCAGAPGNFAADSLKLVEFSQDAAAIYIFGDDSIWKSTDDGQTFPTSKKRDVDGAQINDWVITEDDTIYAAASDDGFYKTTNSGLSWSSTDVGDSMNSIALSPDFDSDETILLGGFAGEVLISDDEGDSFEDTAPLDGAVFVAFDPDYADEDSDGFELIYAVDNADNAIQVGEEDGDDTDWDVLEDDENELSVTGDFYGLQVSADRALYAIADDATAIGEWTEIVGVVRLLLDESDSLWEYADDELTNPEGLWLTPGSNVLWTIDGDELWVLEDTLSGQVTLDSPKDGYQSDLLTTIHIAWDEMRDADDYEYKLDEISGLGLDEAGTTDDTDVNVSVFASSEYDWKVRVAPGEPWHSRWSDKWSFHTALGAPPWSPTLYTPGGTWQYSGLNVELMPAFSWESAKNSDSYQFVLADNAEFTSPLVNEKTPESAYQLDFELEYNSNYFWRVMAYKGNTAISRWSDIGAFTTIEKAVAPPAPAPPATVTQPASAPIVLPTPIPPALLWVIVGIGAALIIAVVVLIIRTRRPV